MGELPPGWASTTIGQITDLKNGRAFKPTDWVTQGLPIVRIQNLNDQRAAFNHYAGEIAEQHSLAGGELLFAWSGTPGTSFGAHVWRGGKAVLNQHIFRIDFDEANLDKVYLKHAINRRLDELIDVAHGGVGLRHVTKGVFESTDIAVPPLAEQQRIVAKLNTLLSRVDGCRERLDRVGPLIKRFRQSVLSEAFSGRLTADWRLRQSGVDTPFVAARKLLGTVGDISGGLTKNGRRDALPLRRPYLRVANVYANELRLAEVDDIGLTDAEFAKTRLQRGDVLVVEGNGSLSQVGRAAIWNDEVVNCCHQNHLIRWRAKSGCVAEYVLLYLLSMAGRRQIEDVAKSTSGLHTLSVSKVGAITLPVPSVDEQAEIVRLVQRLWAFADKLQARLVAATSLVDRARPATLAKAFRGELVPQDPNDEPADMLLARIRAERGVAGTAKPRWPSR